MPTWGKLLEELAQLQREMGRPGRAPTGVSPFDALRRKYLARMHDVSGRATIVYATSWLENKPAEAQQAMSVVLGDVHGFMEACSNVTERELDLVISSPGGDPNAAESIMDYLRTRFDHIRAIVPVAAMSAGTMMALACDEIVMGSHSQLGPIDPQITIGTPEGPRTAPAQAIIDQFELAKKQCQDPANIAAWLPLLRSLGPGLLAYCEHARELSQQFARTQLEAHMFAADDDRSAKAKVAAAWFSDFTTFRSHGRRVSRDDARAQGIKVLDLEADQDFQDAVLSTYHATRMTFNSTPAVKIVENHLGRAYIEQISQQVIQIPVPPATTPTPSPGPAKDAFGLPRPEREGTPGHGQREQPRRKKR
jgi:hypothetical protein